MPHTLPQRPQLLVLAREASHPSPLAPLQFAKPALQANEHPDPAHVRDAFERAGHTAPHARQLLVDDRDVSHPLPAIPSQFP